jgi:hypothetical protein
MNFASYRTLWDRARRGGFAAGVFVLAGALCGAASGGIRFTPPHNWTATSAGGFGNDPQIVGVWTAPRDRRFPFQQNVNVTEVASVGTLRQDVDRNLEALKLQAPVHIIKRQVNRRCRSGVSEVVFLSSPARIASGRAVELTVEQVYTVVRDRLFVGTYMREAGEKLYPGARDSVERMCPRR